MLILFTSKWLWHEKNVLGVQKETPFVSWGIWNSKKNSLIINGEVWMLKTWTIQFWTHRGKDQRKWFRKIDRLTSINEQIWSSRISYRKTKAYLNINGDLTIHITKLEKKYNIWVDFLATHSDPNWTILSNNKYNPSQPIQKPGFWLPSRPFCIRTTFIWVYQGPWTLAKLGFVSIFENSM